jgi:hypothetical protein
MCNDLDGGDRELVIDMTKHVYYMIEKEAEFLGVSMQAYLVNLAQSDIMQRALEAFRIPLFDPTEGRD